MNRLPLPSPPPKFFFFSTAPARFFRGVHLLKTPALGNDPLSLIPPAKAPLNALWRGLRPN